MNKTYQKTQDLPLVSVVIPMYNAAAYLPTCIESVLAQSYLNLEIIAVDDGSPDRCSEIVRSYSDERLVLVQQENRGLAGARNTGIRRARGEYIAFLDADDSWHPSKISVHIEHFISRSDLGVSYSASRFVDEHGSDMGIGQYPQILNVSAADIFCRNPIGNGSAPVIRADVFRDIAFRNKGVGHIDQQFFDETFRQSEDVECWLRIALSTSWVFEGINSALTNYRVNGGGLSANWSKQLAAWERNIEKNRVLAPEFFDDNEGLARAYQYRYLCRRAIQSRDAKNAVKLLAKSLRSDWTISIKDPVRTLVTAACASLLMLLPTRQYDSLERSVMSAFS